MQTPASTAVLALMLALWELPRQNNPIRSDKIDGVYAIGVTPLFFQKRNTMTEPQITALASDERIDKVNENINLIQKKDGLTFGTDAYMLAAFIRTSPRARALDMGSGTGIISLLCATREKLGHIYAAEIQTDFAELGERNIKLNNLENKITQINSDIRSLTPELFGGELDVVFSNPPYMKSGCGRRCSADIKNIARHEENGSIDDFCAAAAKLLRYGGLFYTVWRPDRLIDLTDALRRHKLEPKRMTFVYPDTSSKPAIVLTEAKLGASPSLDLTAPLILYKNSAKENPRILTDEAQKIYDTCTFEV